MLFLRQQLIIIQFLVASIKYLFFIAFGLSTLLLQAQVNESEVLAHLKNAKLKSNGKTAYKNGDYRLAELYLSQFVKKNSSNTAVNYLLGMSYFHNQQYAKAEPLLFNSISYRNESCVFLAYAQIAQENYKDAKLSMTYYQKPKKKSAELKEAYTAVKSTLKFIDKGDTFHLPIPHVWKLNDEVNGKMTEFTPQFMDDKTFFFGKTTPDIAPYYLKTDEYLNDVPRRQYFFTNDNPDSVKQTAAWEFSGFDTKSFDFGGACFSDDGKWMILSVCERREDKLICQLYESKKRAEEWSTPKIFKSKINIPGYSSIQPSLGYDEIKKQPVLYFASNKPGSNGFDIYYSVYDDAKKTFYRSAKVGNKINSTGNEYAPFYDKKNKRLYFSSNGNGGYGGQDIMYSNGKLNEWTDVVILPKPLNSPADDVYYSYYPEKDLGFITSNRSSAEADEKMCCEDIYAFNYKQTEEPEKLVVKAIDPIKPKQTCIPVSKKIMADKLDDVNLKVYKLIGSNKILMNEIVLTDKLDTLCLPNSVNFVFNFKRDDYMAKNIELILNENSVNLNDTLRVQLEAYPRKARTIPNIVYEFDSPKLTEESKRIIDEYIYDVLVDNPEIKIRINSHTDSKGSDTYNQKLSEARAKSVVDYLINVKGIDKNRLSSKGYGESMPVAPNTKPDGSDNPEGRAKNRRTDFEVVGKIVN